MAEPEHPRLKPTELPPFYARKRREIPERWFLLDRQRNAMKLRLAGASNYEIGCALHADPTMNTRGESTPGGYGWRNYITGKAPLRDSGLAAAVSRDLGRLLRELTVDLEAKREEYRALELARLDKAQAAVWDRVLKGNDWAIDRFLGVVDRRIRLLGLEVRESKLTVDGAIGVAPQMLPEVDDAYAAKVTEAIAELAALTPPDAGYQPDPSAEPDSAEVVDVEVVDED